ncbi:NIPSNAP family protein [Fulvimonas soli]|uniref:NIPSNAP protein n=1 Tax=Fulvimonas soli TaxID=155197 RepID=A0A316IHI7_9GAMM|nr:NIPSNAP family protein [Fulvimonas soli]PWK91904.1 NIPSNAP protein [Fulvimonas soli]TNY26031.1 hypothetical protein BV497_10780 [Fulvimonas soli]
MGSTDEWLYELRLYTIAPGRLGDMADRFRNELGTLFPRHGVHPLAGWTATAGAGMPKFVYLMPWRDLGQRARALASFAADPDWAEARARTNGPSELVERFDIHLLKAIAPLRDIPQGAGDVGAVYELAIQSMANGHVAAARQTLLEVELPACVRAGAVLAGAFEMIFGTGLPAAVSLLEWPDHAARASGMAAVEADAALREARSAQLAEHGRCLLGQADRYLLDVVAVQWAGSAQ